MSLDAIDGDWCVVTKALSRTSLVDPSAERPSTQSRLSRPARCLVHALLGQLGPDHQGSRRAPELDAVALDASGSELGKATA
ncbi:hypothetical protein [Sorangium sp. So ce385]|uniref:hypothetical protein n=1 Tax=Sorangium sp. So ce385 TaxID=3133308 RepID=UPI003F5C7E68